jgi:DNA segregation ATPase FtsK/SpoIIIE-like protein
MNFDALKSAKNAYLAKSFTLNVRRILWIILGAFALLAITAGAAFWTGSSKGQEWADSKYLQEREKTLRKAADAETRADVHMESAEVYKAQNDEQKKANQQEAEKRKAGDAELIKNRKIAEETAQKNADKIEKEKKEQYEKIDSDGNDYNRQLNGLCGDVKRTANTNLSVCR